MLRTASGPRSSAGRSGWGGRSRCTLAGQEPTGPLKVQHGLADKLVFSKIKARIGGNIRFFVSGSASLNREVQEWFHAARLLVLEGYGLTETSAFTRLNNPRSTRFGTVGPPLPGSEIKIAADGEITVKGPSVMQGYHNEPEGVGSVVDGWFATGDIGDIDDHGYLRITDRKKDLIKTPAGSTSLAEGRGRAQGGLPARQPGGGAWRGQQVRDCADHP
jgi:long-chain acyl-CoA synthetase